MVWLVGNYKLFHCFDSIHVWNHSVLHLPHQEINDLDVSVSVCSKQTSSSGGINPGVSAASSTIFIETWHTNSWNDDTAVSLAMRFDLGMSSRSFEELFYMIVPLLLLLSRWNWWNILPVLSSGGMKVGITSSVASWTCWPRRLKQFTSLIYGQKRWLWKNMKENFLGHPTFSSFVGSAGASSAASSRLWTTSSD